MTKRAGSLRRILVAIAAALCLAPGVARAQGGPIDDLIKKAMDAFNDLQYAKADSIARSVLSIPSITQSHRTRAQMVIAASAYPEEASAQRRPVALATLKQLVRSDYGLKLPQELTWAGLDSLFEEAKRSTFVMQVTADSQQTVVGLEGLAKVHFKSNKTGLFRLIIAPKTGSGVAVVDSLTAAEGDISFRTMRDERPIFTTGDYRVTITGFEPGGRGDTVTVQYSVRVDAPALTFLTAPAKMDSSKLLKERSSKVGAKAIFPALLVGGAAFALSSVLRGEGNIATQGPAADSKGVAVGGGLALFTIIAGFIDHGRFIPANIAANKAAGVAYEKSIVDTQAENRRRIVEYKTVLAFDLEAR